MADFDLFRAVVLDDASLRELLLTVTEMGAFIELLIHLAGQRGFEVTEEQVRSALEEASRSWIERQVT